jgi:hypothetical protein
MPRLVVALILVNCLSAVPARAQTIGPLCFQMVPFSDVFAMFLVPSGGNQYSATGRNLVAGGAVTSTAFVTGSTVSVSFTSMIPPTGSSHTFFGSANLSVFTGTGPGRCEALNLGSGGCGLGTPITLTLVSCPAGSLADFPPPADGQRRGGGGGS